jgi:hypothetical protein
MENDRQDGELAYVVSKVEHLTSAVCRELRGKTELGEHARRMAAGLARVADRFWAYVRGEEGSDARLIVALHLCENIIADKPLTDDELAQQCADEVLIEDWLMVRGEQPWPDGVLQGCTNQFPDLGQQRVRSALQRLSGRDLLPDGTKRLFWDGEIAALKAKLAERAKPQRPALAGTGRAQLRQALSDAFPDTAEN